MTESKQKREPFFHVSRNDVVPAKKALCIRIGAIVVALLITGILGVILIGESPIKIYGALFTGPFIDVWTLLQNTAILLIFGLIVIPAFRMKFWNMGANGQVLVGCLAAVACMWFLTGKIPNALLIIAMVVTSILASVIWSVLPAIFKARFNTNETLFTLMMNYIAIKLVDYFVFMWDKSGSGNLGIVNLIKHEGWLPNLGNKYLLTIVVSLVLAAFMYIYIRYSKHGFEVDIVGESVNTARYVGINVKKVVVRTLLFSGVICGIMGVLYAGSIAHTVNASVGGRGFTAILVAWLANFNPLIMVLTSFFVVFIESGSVNISTKFHLANNNFANIVIGIIFFCVIGCEFFIRYKVQLSSAGRQKLNKLLHKKDVTEGKEVQ